MTPRTSHVSWTPRKRVRRLVGGLFLPALIAIAATARATPENAPPAARKVFDRAAPAVVKLYGAGAGREHGYGTGVLVSADGKILTTLSLLVMGRNLRAVTADGRAHEARLLRADETSQLALLTIDGDNLPHLTPVATDAMQPGDPVFALTNCFKIADGEEPVSMCRGVLSLRLPALQARRLAQSFDYTGPALVHDAITANPGAAGGPLLDTQGRLVGLIGKIVEAAATNTRLNYAVPGEVLLAFLGEQPSPRVVTSAPAEHTAKPFVGLKLTELGFRHVSAYVERVRPDSPAAKAGIRPDDLIVAIDGQRIVDAAACRDALDRLTPGHVASFTIKRGQQMLVVPVTVGEAP